MHKFATIVVIAMLSGCSQESAPDPELPEADRAYAETAPAEGGAPRFAQLDQGFDTSFPGHETQVIVGQDDLPSRLALLEIEVPPRGIGAPPHRHANEDEIFIVTAGNVTFLNGETEVAAGPGTVASLPRGHFHGFWNPHDEPARMLLAISPGRFDTFFDEVVQKIRAENADNPDQIGQIIAETAAARGVTVDPSRFPASARALMGPPSH